MTSYFWTDLEQAQQRLSNTVVLYDNVPTYIDSITRGDDGIPRARAADCVRNAKFQTKRLDSPKFGRFRTMPTLGWMNPESPDNLGRGCYFLQRTAVSTRTHGLSDGNVQVFNFLTHGDLMIALSRGNIGFRSLMFDEGFTNIHKNDYPELTKAIAVLVPGNPIAVSPKYALAKDGDGVVWLYHQMKRVGILSGQCLYLLRKFFFLREEIMQDNLAVESIREL